MKHVSHSLYAGLAAVVGITGVSFAPFGTGKGQTKANVGSSPSRQLNHLGTGVFVDPNRTATFDAGEVQSTVIPPDKKPQCPKGRLVISDDGSKAPGRIYLHDLGDLNAPPKLATFDSWPPNSDVRILSNDHDIVSLNNGDVLYLRMGQSKAAISPKPAWFDHTYKIPKDHPASPAWGPGARSSVLVWRSKDGGNSFQFVSSIDTGKIDDDWGVSTDGSGGLPQGAGVTVSPGTAGQPIFQMGGTDGPFATVDRASGRVFVSLGLVGKLPSSTSPFLLGPDYLRRTYVAVSSDGGSSWQKAGNLGIRGWRTELVPRGNLLSFSYFAWDAEANKGFSPIDHASIGAFPNPDTGHLTVIAPEYQGAWGWNSNPWDNPILYKNADNKGPADTVSTNIPTQTVLMRSPSSKHLIVAFADTMDSDQGNGYRLYLYKGGQDWTKLPDIRPAVPHKDNFILHLTIADPGTGPLMVYWYDIDATAKKATVRGRILARDDQFSEDIALTRKGNGPRSFSLASARWYGDYHTGSGFVAKTRLTQPSTTNFYPLWLETDGRVHFTRVQFRMAPDPKLADLGPLRVKFYLLLPGERKPSPRILSTARLRYMDGEGYEEEERAPLPITAQNRQN